VLPGKVRQAQLLKVLLDDLLALGLGQIERLGDGLEVLLDGEAAEDAGLLRQVADAHARAAIHGDGGDVLVVEQTLPRVARTRPTIM
jgi:hypothetical protein